MADELRRKGGDMEGAVAKAQVRAAFDLAVAAVDNAGLTAARETACKAFAGLMEALDQLSTYRDA